MVDRLGAAIRSVLDNGNCSGCGGCALVSQRVNMVLSSDGFLRPSVSALSAGEPPESEVKRFRSCCPGVRVSAPKPRALVHPVFGSYVSCWVGWAKDDEFRHAGSSGGVLSALTAFLTEESAGGKVIASAESTSRPGTTVDLTLESRADALASAGSRYAPVTNLAALRENPDVVAVVAKPCEASAARQLFDYDQTTEADRPILLSFFCAGTPSQTATTNLAEMLGADHRTLTSVRYRGNGWPGQFEATDAAGIHAMSYRESWGQHLGRTVQWRCKICVDGTGEHADVAVGDYWHADQDGFPDFTDAEGQSVVIARTVRGHDLLMRAAASGELQLDTVDLDSVAKIQPLQVDRRYTLAARLAGRRLALKKVPKYRGYNLIGRSARRPRPAIRAGLGTFLRSVGLR